MLSRTTTTIIIQRILLLRISLSSPTAEDRKQEQNKRRRLNFYFPFDWFSQSCPARHYEGRCPYPSIRRSQKKMTSSPFLFVKVINMNKIVKFVCVFAVSEPREDLLSFPDDDLE